MRLLITGSVGFIGKYAVEAAKLRGWDVGTSNWAQGISRIFQHDCILHLGAYSSNAGFADNLAKNYSNNIEGLANILDVAKSTGARVVYASSSAVYGEGAEGCFDCEDDSVYPDLVSHYAKSKLVNEMMAESYRSQGLNVLGLRIFNAYGKGDELKEPGKQAPPTWMRAAKERGEPIVIYGDGTQAKDFIHVSDVVECIMRLIESDATGIVNVGTGVATSFNDLAGMISAPGFVGHCEYRPIPDPTSYQHFTRADTKRLLSIIGPYKFKTLEEGLKL